MLLSMGDIYKCIKKDKLQRAWEKKNLRKVVKYQQYFDVTDKCIAGSKY